MRTSIAIAFCSVVLILGTSQIRAQEPTPSPQSAAAVEAKYGVYPIAYREIITRWLSTQLLDPASAEIEWTTEPKLIDMKGRDGQPFHGYVVQFKVNSRNRFGSYTGKQARRVFIRNGEVAAGERVKPR